MVKTPQRLARQMAARGWTLEQINEARERGDRHLAVSHETGRAATRYIHPETGRSVVIEDVSGDVIHVGGDGFIC
ncbi:hypothetical protein ACETK8_02955 [Brevundimonas staleyi]|uniref:Uncharacterized protein n=1 Tax=Brevundimonas staleyi TaxID=74326 RepID=A0ABW0FU14_9CAUL